MAGGFQQRREFGDPPRDIFGKDGVSYPTPNQDDLVIVESYSQDKAQYKRQTYGTPHCAYPAALLVKQKRSNGDDGKVLVTRIYATPRVNQDAYNASIAYQAKSGAHRILTRSSLVPRDGYAATDAFTADSQTPSAVLVDESAAPAEPPYDTLYLRVTLIFEDFGTRAEQDAWNLQEGTTYPYVSDQFPHLVRKYRFPANAVPVLTIGSTTDTAFPAATLLSVEPSNESSRVVVVMATFEAVPTAAQLAALGGAGSDGLGISVTFEEGDNAFPIVEWKRRASGTPYTPAANNEPCPLPGYSTLVLTDQSRTPSQDAATVAVEMRQYQILPGRIIASPDAARLPRTLTAIPATYLNGDTLVTTKQKVAYGSTTDPLINGVLSSKVDATTSLLAVKTNVARTDASYPVLYIPKEVEDAGGAPGAERRQIVEVSDPSLLDAAIDTAIAALLAANGDFHVISYGTNALSPTQAEVVSTVVPAYPELVGAQSDSSIPAKFLQGFAREVDEDWVDTTTIPATAQLLSGPLVLSCRITPEKATRGKRVTTRLPAGTVLPTLTSVRRNERGQYQTVVESITDGTTPLPTLTGLVEDETSQVAIGGGNFLRTVTTVSDVFAETSFSAEIPNLIPERFRPLAATRTTATTSAGTAAAPTLSTGQFRVSVAQVTEQTIRTEITALDATTLPATITASETIGGQKATVTEVLAATPQSFTPTALTIEGPNELNLGNGYSVLTSKAVPAFPVLSGGKWDDKLGVGQKFTRQKMPTATAAGLVGGVGVDVTPLDALRSEVETRTVDATLLTAYTRTFPVTVPRIEFPDVLVSVAVELNEAVAAGQSTETGSQTRVGNGTLSLAIPNSAQSSISIIPGVTPLIQSVYADNVEATDTYLFALIGTPHAALLSRVGASPWPLFQPVSHAICCKGQKVSASVSANVRFSASFQQSNGDGSLSTSLAESHGTGFSADVSGVTRTTIIKPTIHGAINLGTCTFALSAPVSATSSIGPITASKSMTVSCKASVSPGNLAATPGVNAIPTSGLYAKEITPEPYSGDYMLVRIRTIDFASLNITLASSDSATSAPADVAPISLVDTATGYSGNPTVTSQPASTSVVEGTVASLTAGASGVGPVSYQWYSGTPTGTNAPIAGETSSTYSTTNAGTYYAVATDTYGTIATSVATVITTPARAITTQPANVTATVGGAATFSVVATGTPPITYQWHKLSTGPIGGATASSYTIGSVATGDADSYYVTVTDANGSTDSSSATLTVNSNTNPPTITTQPTSTAAASSAGDTNSNVSFMVAATASGTLAYQWFKDGNSLGPSATSSTLSLFSVGTADAGSYTCNVSDPTGNVTSAAAVLTVYSLSFVGINSGQTITGNDFGSGSTPTHSYTLSLTCTPAPTADMEFNLSEQIQVSGSSVTTGKYKTALNNPYFLTTPQFTVTAGNTSSNQLYYFPPNVTVPGSSTAGGPVKISATAGPVVEQLLFSTQPAGYAS